MNLSDLDKGDEIIVFNKEIRTGTFVFSESAPVAIKRENNFGDFAQRATNLALFNSQTSHSNQPSWQMDSDTYSLILKTRGG